MDVYVDVFMCVNCVRGCVYGHVGQMVTGCHVASRGAVGCKRVVELDMSESVKKKYVFD